MCVISKLRDIKIHRALQLCVYAFIYIVVVSAMQFKFVFVILFTLQVIAQQQIERTPNSILVSNQGNWSKALANIKVSLFKRKIELLIYLQLILLYQK